MLGHTNHATLPSESEELNCAMWADDIITRGTNFDDLLYTLDSVLGRLERVGLGR